jgi:hypothetical protein
MDQRSLMNGTEGSLLSNAFQTYLEWREALRETAATLEAASNGDEAAMQDLAMRFMPGGRTRGLGRGGNFRSVASGNLRAMGLEGVNLAGRSCRDADVFHVLPLPPLGRAVRRFWEWPSFGRRM